jgi:hypothetical protein
MVHASRYEPNEGESVGSACHVWSATIVGFSARSIYARYLDVEDPGEGFSEITKDANAMNNKYQSTNLCLLTDESKLYKKKSNEMPE